MQCAATRRALAHLPGQYARWLLLVRAGRRLRPRPRHQRRAPPLRRASFVLYWCMVNHRAEENPALDAAIALGNHLKLPVAVYQALRPGLPPRLGPAPRLRPRGHGGAARRLRRAQASPTGSSCPAIPGSTSPGSPSWAAAAAAIVSDLFPAFIIPGHLRGAAKALDVPLFAVDALVRGAHAAHHRAPARRVHPAPQAAEAVAGVPRQVPGAAPAQGHRRREEALPGLRPLGRQGPAQGARHVRDRSLRPSRRRGSRRAQGGAGHAEVLHRDAPGGLRHRAQ